MFFGLLPVYRIDYASSKTLAVAMDLCTDLMSLYCTSHTTLEKAMTRSSLKKVLDYLNVGTCAECGGDLDEVELCPICDELRDMTNPWAFPSVPLTFYAWRGHAMMARAARYSLGGS